MMYVKFLILFVNLQNMDPFLSYDGLHQLHIFIFTLAVFHVLYCLITMLLSKLKVLWLYYQFVLIMETKLRMCIMLQMKIWKSWENEAKTAEYQFSHGMLMFSEFMILLMFDDFIYLFFE